MPRKEIPKPHPQKRNYGKKIVGCRLLRLLCDFVDSTILNKIYLFHVCFAFILDCVFRFSLFVSLLFSLKLYHCDITAHTVLLYVLFCLIYMYCTLYILYILYTVHTVHVPCSLFPMLRFHLQHLFTLLFTLRIVHFVTFTFCCTALN